MTHQEFHDSSYQVKYSKTKGPKRRANKGTGKEAMSDDEAFDGFGDDGGESGE